LAHPIGLSNNDRVPDEKCSISVLSCTGNLPPQDCLKLNIWHPKTVWNQIAGTPGVGNTVGCELMGL